MFDVIKNRTYYILIICSIFLIGCDNVPPAEELFLEAEKLEVQGKFKEAIPILNEAIKIDPTFLGAYINRGADYSALGNYREAVRNYKIVLKKDPLNQLALLNIGNNYKRLNEYRKAVNYYDDILMDKNGNRMIELTITDADGNNVNEFNVPFYEVCYERGLALYELKSWNSALADFKFCIESGYMVPESRYMCGAVYEIWNMNEEACNEYSIAADLGDQEAKDSKSRVCD